MVKKLDDSDQRFGNYKASKLKGSMKFEGQIDQVKKVCLTYSLEFQSHFDLNNW